MNNSKAIYNPTLFIFHAETKVLQKHHQSFNVFSMLRKKKSPKNGFHQPSKHSHTSLKSDQISKSSFISIQTHSKPNLYESVAANRKYRMSELLKYIYIEQRIFLYFK